MFLEIQNSIFIRMQLISVMTKLHFQQPLFQSSVSRDVSDIKQSWKQKVATLNCNNIKQYYCILIKLMHSW